jgi:predicted DNA-binding transcriptional regulator YafY
VRIRFSYPGASEGEVEYEREMEPYKIEGGHLVAYSYYRGAFRTVELDRIINVQLRPESFAPRRTVEL